MVLVLAFILGLVAGVLPMYFIMRKITSMPKCNTQPEETDKERLERIYLLNMLNYEGDIQNEARD